MIDCCWNILIITGQVGGHIPNPNLFPNQNFLQQHSHQAEQERRSWQQDQMHPEVAPRGKVCELCPNNLEQDEDDHHQAQLDNR